MNSAIYQAGPSWEIKTLREKNGKKYLLKEDTTREYENLIKILADCGLNYLSKVYKADLEYLQGTIPEKIPFLEKIVPKLAYDELPAVKILYIPNIQKDYRGKNIQYGLEKLGENTLYKFTDMNNALRLVKNKEIDIIIYNLLMEESYTEMLYLFEEAYNNNIKIAVIDQEDGFGVDELLSNAEFVSVYFKREMMAELVYPSKVKPLGLSTFNIMPYKPARERANNLLFVGTPWIDRMVYINKINKKHNLDILIEGRRAQQYFNLLNDTVYSLDLPGAGYDNLRFWESATVGCVNISFYKPIVSIGEYRETECFYYNTVHSLVELLSSAEFRDQVRMREMQELSIYRLQDNTAAARVKQMLGMILEL